MENIMAVILAAGEGTRMKSSRSKVMFPAAGKPLIGWVADALNSVDAHIIAVVGKGADEVEEYFGDTIEYAAQHERLGSGHAVMCASEQFKGKGGYVVILAGDSPLIKGETVKLLVDHTLSGGYGACLLTAVFNDPTGYGRIVRDSKGNVLKIVEQKDASEEEKKIQEVNASMYCVKEALLSEALKKLTPANAQGEYYLTDIVEIFSSNGKKVGAIPVRDVSECAGVNTRVQLAEVSAILRKRILDKLMLSGVTIIDPANTYIGADVEVGVDTVIHPNVTIDGESKIGSSCVIYSGSRIEDSRIGDGTSIQSSVILKSMIGSSTTIGPFAYLRPNSVVGDKCRVGDFVEVKNSVIASGAKVSHLTYIGDGEVGENTNVGCGVVFVNYDGAKKYRTVVGKNCFIGCNTNLVAPVRVDDGAYIAAGSTVTENVPKNSLCIARARQIIKTDWINIKDRK